MRRHQEGHNTHRIGWLRAAVLGANDGTISVASLVVGIAAAGTGRELTGIYVERGLPLALARQVAEAMSVHDALGAHARDELGLTEVMRARPVQAALASAGSFALGSLVPLAAILLSPRGEIVRVTTISALAALMVLGGAAAWAGGAPRLRGALRMLFWGSLAMGLTALVGKLSGAMI